MSLEITVKVTPNATFYRWKISQDGILKCYVLSPATQGQANTELITKLAKILRIAPSCIHLLSGTTTRLKRLKIDIPISYHELLTKLGLTTDTQKTIF
jgi:uncharacterized protein YggU (UPF0235/DUF167 family)